METTICGVLGIAVPIVMAPLPGIELAAAVSNAGGLGMVPLTTSTPEIIRQRLAGVRALSQRPFAVNLITEFPQAERLEICLDEGVRIVSFFWGDAAPLVRRAKAAGATVMQTVGSADDARRAVESGVDIIVAQGWEAGGHVRGTVSTMALVPAIVDAVGPTPVIAAGGIADGRGLAAVLALGAAGAWIGTRFLASEEAAIHPDYQARLLTAKETDTAYLENLFDGGWPDAPHRTLRNSTVVGWEAAGRPRTGQRPGEGEVIGAAPARGEIRRYEVLTPTPDVRGNVEAMPLWAGQGVGMVRRREPAAQIVAGIVAEASAILRRTASVLAR